MTDLTVLHTICHSIFCTARKAILMPTGAAERSFQLLIRYIGPNLVVRLWLRGLPRPLCLSTYCTLSSSPMPRCRMEGLNFLMQK